MATASLLTDKVVPKTTENFLLSCEGVADASVWIDGDELRAHVTLLDDNYTERDLKAMCGNAIGIHQTPSTIMLMRARRRAA
ncbi:MAG: hypothetical protein HONBIEJF_01184 [Fimbriimonadaceae bacterium]|nr:hypothetical protein [Fimbriimonadaceae bacterium]